MSIAPACRYARKQDRDRCHRQDNPLPRPSHSELLAMCADSHPRTVARKLGCSTTTLRIWLVRAKKFGEYNKDRVSDPKPRPNDRELLTMYASKSVTSIAKELGYNTNTVRSWVNRAINRDEYNPRSRAQFNARRVCEELR